MYGGCQLEWKYNIGVHKPHTFTLMHFLFCVVFPPPYLHQESYTQTSMDEYTLNGFQKPELEAHIF